MTKNTGKAPFPFYFPVLKVCGLTTKLCHFLPFSHLFIACSTLSVFHSSLLANHKPSCTPLLAFTFTTLLLPRTQIVLSQDLQSHDF